MKLSQIAFDTNTPKEIEILDPLTGKSFDKPAFISVYAYDSKVGKAAYTESLRNLMALRADEKNMIDGSLKDEIVNAEMYRSLAKMTTGWKGFEDENGKALKWSVDNAAKAFEQSEYLFKVVNEYISDLGNFKKA